ncbi:PREDICTED: uncharacterized protein LOC108366732 [Rhagoletis zephyria]|uniref:uncharacterized protein LOC108366732 n=1 Tax=Rhagoletis zephyria TaxID=28612 RepID=UPI0008113C52|nr:PREDICTED: uncharacterized protein LOC108366732 [Rhagoletis zephyria]
MFSVFNNKLLLSSRKALIRLFTRAFSFRRATTTLYRDPNVTCCLLVFVLSFELPFSFKEPAGFDFTELEEFEEIDLVILEVFEFSSTTTGGGGERRESRRASAQPLQMKLLSELSKNSASAENTRVTVSINIVFSSLQKSKYIKESMSQ